MKRITTTVLGLAALVVTLVLGVVSAGAAQAHEFLWTGTPGSLLLVLGDGPQLFKATEGSTAEVICKHVHFHGKAEKESQLSVVVVGEYTNCEAAGFAATVSTAEYEVNADESVSVLKPITIVIGGGLCEIVVSAQNTLKTIKYLVDPNSENQRILAHVEVEKIASKINGGAGACGAEGTHTDGLYRGLLLAWVHGSGTLKWS